MKRTISSLIALSAGALLSTSVFAVSLNGTQWQTIDDKTGEKKAVIQLTESGGKVSGKIIKVLNKEKADALCTKCPGSLKNKPVEGLQILSGLKADGNNQWSDGKLVTFFFTYFLSGLVSRSFAVCLFRCRLRRLP